MLVDLIQLSSLQSLGEASAPWIFSGSTLPTVLWATSMIYLEKIQTIADPSGTTLVASIQLKSGPRHKRQTTQCPRITWRFPFWRVRSFRVRRHQTNSNLILLPSRKRSTTTLMQTRRKATGALERSPLESSDASEGPNPKRMTILSPKCYHNKSKTRNYSKT